MMKKYQSPIISDEMAIDQHKRFALTFSGAFPCLFMLLLPWLFDTPIPWWPLLVSVILMFCYFLFPAAIAPVFKSWMAIASVIGWVNTRLILALVFYVIIFPMGFFLRLLGKLQYQNTPDLQQPSFWITRPQGLKKEDLERPF